MTKERFHEIRKNIAYTNTWIERLIVVCKRQERSKITAYLDVVIKDLETLTTYDEIRAEMEGILNNFGVVLSAMEQDDYVLFGDYVEELLLKPLKELVGIWCAEGEDYLTSDLEHGYYLEYTATGLVTLRKDCNGRQVYLHYNVSPGMETEEMVLKWAEAGVETYLIAGLGLGYHVARLLQHTEANICVYEKEEELIRFVKESADINWFFENEKVQVIHDPAYVKFASAVMEAENRPVNPITGKSDTKACIHYPSITSIEDERIREAMLRIYLKQDNVERWMNQMIFNISQNTKQVKRYVTEIANQIEGNRVYIVAGGPSLDKNLHLLKRRKDKDIVMVVGTSLKKCVKDEINPDYVITTDPKSEGAYQFAGMEECGVPMILMSTAYREIVASYQGEKYLLFQEGYLPAERLAKEKKQPLICSGGSVSTTALDLCIKLKAKEVVFLGLDLANTGGDTAECRDTRKEDNGLWVEDIKGNPVQTTNAFNEYRLWIENHICDVRENGCETVFYDATEGGAKIVGTIVTSLKDIM